MGHEAIRQDLERKRIVVVDSFISRADCRQIVSELEFSLWHASSVVNRKSGRLQSSVQENFRSGFTSLEEWFSQPLLARIADLQTELHAMLAIDPAKLESWQATRYAVGQRFGYHLDCGLWKRSKAGERARTILLYLDAPQKGGETHFRALDRVIKPRAGRIVVWNNLLPSGGCNHAMIHSGLAVEKGAKTTLVTWERQRPCRKENL